MLLTLTLNNAGFPANESEWYASGKLTLTSNSSSFLCPTIWSSNVSMKLPVPNVKSNPSAFPPSNASPSTNPSKLIFTTSSNAAFAFASSNSFNLPDDANNFSISWFTVSSVTFAFSFLIFSPLYSPNFISGNTGTSNTTS